jgi:hypothetical protein
VEQAPSGFSPRDVLFASGQATEISRDLGEKVTAGILSHPEETFLGFVRFFLFRRFLAVVLLPCILAILAGLFNTKTFPRKR